jgi:hypothetical protein
MSGGYAMVSPEFSVYFEDLELVWRLAGPSGIGGRQQAKGYITTRALFVLPAPPTLVVIKNHQK